MGYKYPYFFNRVSVQITPIGMNCKNKKHRLSESKSEMIFVAEEPYLLRLTEKRKVLKIYGNGTGRRPEFV